MTQRKSEVSIADYFFLTGEMKIDKAPITYEDELVNLVTFRSPKGIIDVQDSTKMYCDHRLNGYNHDESFYELNNHLATYNIEPSGVAFLDRLAEKRNEKPYNNHKINADNLRIVLSNVYHVDKVIKKENNFFKSLLYPKQKIIQKAVSSALQQIREGKNSYLHHSSEIDDKIRLIKKSQTYWKSLAIGFFVNEHSDKKTLFVDAPIKAYEPKKKEASKKNTKAFKI